MKPTISFDQTYSQAWMHCGTKGPTMWSLKQWILVWTVQYTIYFLLFCLRQFIFSFFPASICSVYQTRASSPSWTDYWPLWPVNRWWKFGGYRCQVCQIINNGMLIMLFYFLCISIGCGALCTFIFIYFLSLLTMPVCNLESINCLMMVEHFLCSVWCLLHVPSSSCNSKNVNSAFKFLLLWPCELGQMGDFYLQV